MQKTTAKSVVPAQWADLFLTLWLLAYLAGATAGLLAARYAAASMGDILAALCVSARDKLSAFPLFGCALVFFVLTVLLSQLPGGSALVALLTAAKAFSSAYLLGVFYQFRLLAGLDVVLLRLALHTALLLPACYALASRCCSVHSGEKEARRVWPVFLPFLYAVALAVLERILWTA